MNAYIYQAAMLCEGCALKVCAEKTVPGKKVLLPADLDENTYDSDTYPKGPYSNGGGEADCPQHCDSCGEFLENPLTTDGYAYVKEAVSSAIEFGRDTSDGVVLSIWQPFYCS